MCLGCDSTGTKELETLYVVESILVAEAPMPPLLFSRVSDIDSIYIFEQQAETGAEVTIQVTGPVINEVIAYKEFDELPGLYLPGEYSVPVQPLHQYDLVIKPKNSSALITASTVVPDTFRVLGKPTEQLVYQGSDQLEFVITPSESPGRDLSFYIFTTEALEPLERNLVPFAESQFDNGESLEELSISGSPIVNESNYEVNPDGTLKLRYPWIGINFYGPNLIHINVLDDNSYNFERSRSQQEGQSTFAPGEIPNPLPHIRGAHGLFGSQARATLLVTVLE